MGRARTRQLIDRRLSFPSDTRAAVVMSGPRTPLPPRTRSPTFSPLFLVAMGQFAVDTPSSSWFQVNGEAALQ